MTTIVYRDGVMASDSRAYAGFNAVLGVKVKTRRCPDGTLVGCSTNQVGLSETVLDWYETGADRKEIPDAPELRFTLIAVKPSGEAFYGYDSFNLSGPITGEFFAIGSGEALAIGALHMGATAAEAVEIACRCDVWSGLPVRIINHQDG